MEVSLLSKVTNNRIVAHGNANLLQRWGIFPVYEQYLFISGKFTLMFLPQTDGVVVVCSR